MISRQRVLTSSVALMIALYGVDSHAQSVIQTIDSIGESLSVPFAPGNLVVSRSVYAAGANAVTVGQTLPPDCTLVTTPPSCVPAIANGTYPTVFNNNTVDGSFGVTSPIFLDQMLPEDGIVISSFAVPTSQMVTSFSSKSELALNVSTDGRFITFMGYQAPVGALDVSNANTPAVVDPTNPVPQSVLRVVGQVDSFGNFNFTETNAYSGNNGRAAVLNPTPAGNLIYTAGNAGNGANPQPTGVVIGTGTQILTASNQPEASQDPALPTPLGSFNILQVPGNKKTDKIGKDTNFRGLTIFNNVVYTTKGSGSNGINTVYFIDTSGSVPGTGTTNGIMVPAACPTTGSGVPNAQATLPTASINFNAANLAADGVTPYNMCILNGFNTVLAKTTTTSFPFGIWFANATTLYVADEGNGNITNIDPTTGTVLDASEQTTAGLQKWVFNSTKGMWEMAYVLSAGLNLGVPYTIADYPTGINPVTNLPWAPATDGLRNLTGRVNKDGTVTLWAITSTVSGSGDQGADPNKLVSITDTVAATTLPAGESFKTVRTAVFGEVLRGVSFTPSKFNIATP